MKNVVTGLAVLAALAGIAGFFVGGLDYFALRDQVATNTGAIGTTNYIVLTNRVSTLEGLLETLTPEQVLQSLNAETAKLRKEAEQIRKDFLAPLPPIGSILPYVGDPEKLPPGWILCKGQTISEDQGFAREDVASGLWGKVIPNMDGRVVRGLSLGENSGAIGGSDGLPNHSHSLDGLVTGWISDTRQDPGHRPYYVRDDGNPSSDNNWLSTENGRRPQDEGHHRHELGGNTGNLVGEPEFKPSYVAVHFIMRIM